MKKEKFKNEVYIINNEKDVLNFVTKSSTKEQRDKFNIGDIFINAAVCHDCNTYIRSKNKHHFKKCKCGKLGVDGGSHYIKRFYDRDSNYADIIEVFYDVIDNK